MNKEILASQLSVYQLFISSALLIACAFTSNIEVAAVALASSVVLGFLTLGAFVSATPENASIDHLNFDLLSSPLVRVLASFQSISFFIGIFAFALSIS